MMNKDKKQKEENAEKLEAQKEQIKDMSIQIKKSELDNLKNELEAQKNKAQDYYDRFLRLQAEFDNAKKRLQREQQEFVKYANEGIILELLGILDDLERSVEARESKHQDPEAFLKGIEMILSHLYELLKKNNVRPIEAKGKIFDPNFHEALMQAESNEYPENTVVEELQKGYLLGDRVIRTTKAKVSTAVKNKIENSEGRSQKTETGKSDI